MTEEQLLKKIKIYKGIAVLLVTLLFACIGYSYGLRLDIDALQLRVDRNYDVIVNSYIRNIHNSLSGKLDIKE